MTEDQARTALAQNREFPETMAIMARIRAALAERLFQTAVNDKDQREELFLRVQTLDAMQDEMKKLLATNASEKAMEEYAERIATTGK